MSMEHVTNTLNRLSMQLLELENALTEVAIDRDVSTRDIDTLSSRARSLRDLTNSLWATEVIDRNLTYADTGIKAFSGDGYIEIEYPYELVSKSSLFRVFSKRLSLMKSLVPVTEAWHYLTKQIVRSYGSLPFQAPLTQAIIDITVLAPDRRKRDPDHFFFRPIQDGLVRNRILADDNTGNVDIAFHYGSDTESPCVIVQVRPDSVVERPPVRSKGLIPVPVLQNRGSISAY